MKNSEKVSYFLQLNRLWYVELVYFELSAQK